MGFHRFRFCQQNESLKSSKLSLISPVVLLLLRSNPKLVGQFHNQLLQISMENTIHLPVLRTGSVFWDDPSYSKWFKGEFPMAGFHPPFFLETPSFYLIFTGETAICWFFHGKNHHFCHFYRLNKATFTGETHIFAGEITPCLRVKS